MLTAADENFALELARNAQKALVDSGLLFKDFFHQAGSAKLDS